MFKSRGLDPIGVCLARIAAPAALAAGIAVITVWALDRLNARDLATEARAIENRAFTLRVQAVTSGSLACLEAATDSMLREPCEKAVFSSAKSTAAAASYVAAQLSVLSAGGEHVRDGFLSHLTEIATLRRAIELDPFGIVAHVLAKRTGCRPDACDFFALLDDSSRVSANLAEQAFDGHVKSHMADWSNGAGVSPPTSPTSVVVRPATKLFFPSASSIPSINIMASEPAIPAASQQPQSQQPHETTASADAATRPRKPLWGAPAGRPASARSLGRPPSTPLQLVPPTQ